MSASQFASFAAYTPPPDEQHGLVASTAPKRSHTAWFQNTPGEGSYQSGAIPTFTSSTSDESVAFAEEGTSSTNQWETTYGWRTDILAFGAYILGPISALLLLIFETQNDYIRFHAYQSALLTTPLMFLRILLSIAQFPPSIKTLFTLTIFAIQLSAGYCAYRDAAQNVLLPFHVPFIGAISAKWLADE